jgi:hypothetical protein
MTTHAHHTCGRPTILTQPPHDWNSIWHYVCGAAVALVPIVDFVSGHEMTGNHYVVSALGAASLVLHWCTRK